jgi:hypothetical protein
MIGTIIITIFLILLATFIFIAYKNERDYKKKQDAKKKVKKHQKPIIRKVEKRTPATKVAPQKEEEESVVKKQPEAVEVIEKETPPAPQKRPEPIEEPKAVTLPEYPEFDHARLLEMGLSDDEAKEFVAELIPQLTAQIPLIEEAFEKEDFHSIERLTHSIKGSSTTVGKGGVSALLVDFNTYIKHGTDLPTIQAYITHLKTYTKALEKQYS